MKRTDYNNGFTLVEMIVSIGIFTLVAVAAVSALASVIDANQRSRSLSQANNNLDFSLQTMVREIRNGFAYGCDASNPGSVPNNSSDCKGETEFAFINSNRDEVVYSLTSDDKIERSVDNTGVTQIITPPEVTVNHLEFSISGAHTNQQQSRVTVTAQAQAGSGENTQAVNLQTTATQRLLYTPSS
jgi:prepilin-type N-terminal cleavage/methylation domain-containing protein